VEDGDPKVLTNYIPFDVDGVNRSFWIVYFDELHDSMMTRI